MRFIFVNILGELLQKVFMKYLLLLPFLFLIACKSTPPLVGEGLPKANLIDTFKQKKTSSAKFFVAEKVNGIKIPNAHGRSMSYSSGQGNYLTLASAERVIPVSTIKVSLAASWSYAMPIAGVFANNDNAFIKGVVKLEVQEGVNYLVKGHISEDYTAVWIENTYGTIVTDIVEQLGSDKVAGNKEKTRIFELRKQGIKDSKKSIFNRISQGEPLHLVENKLGHSGTVVESERNFKIIRFNNIGSIRFRCFNNRSCFMYKKMEIIAPSKERLRSLAKYLDEVDPHALRYGLKNYLEFDLSNPAAMDIFANKLWEIRQSEESSLIKASVMLCKMIGTSGYNRYRSLLKSILQEEESIDDDLVEQARESLLRLSRGEGTQFVRS
jgi:hypothetical protein